MKKNIFFLYFRKKVSSFLSTFLHRYFIYFSNKINTTKLKVTHLAHLSVQLRLVLTNKRGERKKNHFLSFIAHFWWLPIAFMTLGFLLNSVCQGNKLNSGFS
jgi:hypothetical protein